VALKPGYLESPLDSKEIKPVYPKGNQPWIFIGRTDAEAEGPILGPPHVKSWFSGKDPDAGKDRRQKENRATEAEMVVQHHQFNGHEFEQTPRDNEGQGSLAAAVHRVAKSRTRLSDWTTTTSGNQPGKTWGVWLLHFAPGGIWICLWSVRGPVCWRWVYHQVYMGSSVLAPRAETAELNPDSAAECEISGFNSLCHLVSLPEEWGEYWTP